MYKRLALLAAGVLIQAGMLATIPAQKLPALYHGTPVLLMARPYDPYSLLSGYYARLSYDISQPPGEWHDLAVDAPVYVTLARKENGLWEALSASSEWPAIVPEGMVVIRGISKYGRIEYGLESYFVPETERGLLEEQMRQHPEGGRAEVKIDQYGRAVLVRVYVEGL